MKALIHSKRIGRRAAAHLLIQSPRPSSGHGRRGLTLIEVLVAVVIVAILAGFLLTTIPKMRQASRRTQTQQHINTIQAAVDKYYLDHRAYPGPLSDATVAAVAGAPRPKGIGAAGRPTMSENLVLGLLGGLVPDATGGEFKADRVGKGAANVSTLQGSPPRAYLDTHAARAILSLAGTQFTDEKRGTAGDTEIPEFLDGFAEPLPILYLRARPGFVGIMSDAGTPGGGKMYQYDLRQITAYTMSDIGLPSGRPHGLRELGYPEAIPEKLTGAGPYQALEYFRLPGGSGPVKNADGTPRQKDRFILISAGSDRVYGTADDMTSFGDVGP